MALSVTGEMVSQREMDRSSIVVSTNVAEVPAENIAIYIGATVGAYRNTEIVNAWQWLWNGIRDRNLMQTFGGVIYSGADIDHLDENSRLTSGVFATFGDNDVFIGVGQLVVAEWLDAVEPVEAGFTLLIQHAMELSQKVA